ncbi:AI-2E family transporter [Rhodalgimonas zhirmunskyi]|uniref:AI-2E family transporter n=1 Tax=Rhodalgimonas zhirmunskyi TaxID=2964767 RepID=A0AAJ1U7R1_9RHOB|nr:AI-2E family transporter [Rhodoalgimonas zhirmunskyi]MDQ2094966.1 AI-2E family transporter [Rhodoalgimonas zhirmunskyi]
MSAGSRVNYTSHLLVGVAAAGVILYFAEAFLAPVLLAMVAGVIVTPLNDLWEKLGLPRVLSALVSLFMALAVIGVLVLSLQPVVIRLIDEAPKIARDIDSSLRTMRTAMKDFDDIKNDVAKAVKGEEQPAQESTSPSSNPTGSQDTTSEVVETAAQAAARAAAKAQAEESNPVDDAAKEMPTMTDALLLAPAIVGQVIIFAGTLFFFISSRDEIYGWLLRVMPKRRGGTPMDEVHLKRAEKKVSRYFLTITMINAGLAVATGAMLSAFGLPGALEWAVVIFFANFIVYLGPAIFGISLIFAGIAAFDGIYAILPALCFFGFNLIEGQFITPMLVGREMRINPLIVFLSVTFGLWFWGAIGGIVMIPILVWGLVLFDAQAEPNPAP